MKALHFGAGNIGRGLIGQFLVNSGFDLVFADINQNLVDLINLNHKYDIKTWTEKTCYIEKIEKIHAININNPKIISEISLADVITISVGINFVYSLVELLTQGIKYRIKINNYLPLNIIACENVFRCSTNLKIKIKSLLSTEFHDFLDKNISFIDSVIDRISSSNNVSKNSLLVHVEQFKEWIVDRTQFKHKIPNIIGIKYSNYLDAFFKRKFFTLNTGHVITAYLGFLKGYNTIFQAISDNKICNITYKAMQESGQVLIDSYSFCFNKLEHDKYINSVLLRFKNPHLTDNLTRVCRNPLKKLNKHERLISPLLGTLKYKTSNTNLVKGIVSALCYYHVKDYESIQLRSLIKTKGIKYVLCKISSLNPLSPIIAKINICFNAFKNKYIVT